MSKTEENIQQKINEIKAKRVFQEKGALLDKRLSDIEKRLDALEFRFKTF